MHALGTYHQELRHNISTAKYGTGLWKANLYGVYCCPCFVLILKSLTGNITVGFARAQHCLASRDAVVTQLLVKQQLGSAVCGVHDGISKLKELWHHLAPQAGQQLLPEILHLPLNGSFHRLHVDGVAANVHLVGQLLCISCRCLQASRHRVK